MVNFVMSCYILAGLTMLFSLVYIIASKQHSLTSTVLLIYSLEIITQSFSVALFKVPADKTRLVDSLTAVSFGAHWMGLGIFTGGYITVATQIPLLRP